VLLNDVEVFGAAKGPFRFDEGIELEHWDWQAPKAKR
jgi:hypothetical protein